MIKHFIKIYKKMKLLYGFILLALVHAVFSGRGVGGSSPILQNHYSGASSASAIPQVIYRPRVINRYSLGKQIDSYIRQKFWYYLPDCHLTYLAHLQIVVGCQYLITYQNYIGSYLAIVTYSDHSGETHIDTFVRLGDGFTHDTDIFKPIVVHPVVIQLDLGDGEYFVSYEEYKQASFKWSEKYIRSKKIRQSSEEIELKHYCSQVEKYIKKQYWYYLTDDTATINLHSSRSRTTCYCSFTFLNYVGLWQVVGAYNNGPIVRTFVRLGDGSNPQKAEKCQIIPSFA